MSKLIRMTPQQLQSSKSKQGFSRAVRGLANLWDTPMQISVSQLLDKYSKGTPIKKKNLK